MLFAIGNRQRGSAQSKLRQLRHTGTPSSGSTPTHPERNPSRRSEACRSTAAAASAVRSTGTFDNALTLSDLGVHDTIVLRGADASNTVHFSLPQTQVVKTATMNLRYHFSPGLIPR